MKIGYGTLIELLRHYTYCFVIADVASADSIRPPFEGYSLRRMLGPVLGPVVQVLGPVVQVSGPVVQVLGPVAQVLGPVLAIGSPFLE